MDPIAIILIVGINLSVGSLILNLVMAFYFGIKEGFNQKPSAKQEAILNLLFNVGIVTFILTLATIIILGTILKS